MGRRAKNILLITSDQWRGDCLSANGHPCVKTPNYDALIEDGVYFRRHYSVCAPCGPARASLLTGMYMQNHRSVRNGTPLDDRHTNIAREARKAGYRPVLFGYTDTGLDPRKYPDEEARKHGYESMMPGFEEGLLLPAEKPDAWIKFLRKTGYGFDSLEATYRQVSNYPGSDLRGRTYAPPAYADEHCQTAFLTREAISYIDAAPDNWFVHLSYLRPHPPFVAPEPWNRMYDPNQVPLPIRADVFPTQSAQHPWLAAALGPYGDWFDPWIREALQDEHAEKEIRQIRATYYGLVSKVDHYVGGLLDFLKSTGRYDDTLIILTSDHGELLGDQWLFGKRGYFDSGYHVPLIIRDPDKADRTRGRSVNHFTESVDVMPTILDWLGLDAPRQCDGFSLLPWIEGRTPVGWRTEAHWEYDFRDVQNPGLERELGIAMDHCQLNVIRIERYKYVHFTDLPPLFFDLENDPAEIMNLARDERVANEELSLASRMLSWRMANDERELTAIKVSRDKVFSR